MLTEVFVFYRTNFDPSENDAYHAREKLCLGFLESREDADRYLQELNKSETKKKQWDGEEYPRFHFEEIRRIWKSTRQESSSEICGND